MSLEPTGHVCFSGHLLSSQGLWATCLGESPSNPVRTGVREGVNLHLRGPLPADSCPPRSGGGCVPYPPFRFHSFPLLPPTGAAALPGVSEPRVGPAHPSRQPMAPAASGMLQPPSFSPQPCPTPACQAPLAWSHPTRAQSLTVYNSR